MFLSTAKKGPKPKDVLLEVQEGVEECSMKMERKVVEIQQLLHCSLLGYSYYQPEMASAISC